MIIANLGCGWYGRALAVALMKTGARVKGSTTSAEKLSELAALGIQPYLVQFDGERQAYAPAFFYADVLVISIPPKFKKGELDIYQSKITQVITAIQKYAIKQVIYISSTGVYGDNQGVVTETTEPLPDTPSGQILYEAEKLFLAQTDFKTTIIRFGGLIGPARDPGRFFAGKKDIPNGRSPVNLIHLDDAVAITQAIIEQQAYGHIFNACAPDHPAKAEFYGQATKLARLGQPVFKDELLSSKIVKPETLEAVLHYSFKVEKLM